MFRFADSQYLWLLLLIPILLGLGYWFARRLRRRMEAFGEAERVEALSPKFSRRKRLVGMVLLLCALALLIVMVARPQRGVEMAKETRRGIEVAVMLDVSNSMLAQDVQPNRMERAKLFVFNLIDRLQNDRISFGIFAGEAYSQLPITSDYVSAKQFVRAASTDMLTDQGTNLAAAIAIADNSFSEREDVGKAIIIITDGEDHEGDVEEAAKSAKQRGHHVYVLGIGSPDGARIPNGYGTFMQDEDGQIVESALNEELCRQTAEWGGGKYFHISRSNAALRGLQKELSQLQQAEESVEAGVYKERFQIVGILALILLIIEMFVLETTRKNKASRASNPAKSVPKLLLLCFGFFFAVSASAQTAEWKAIRRGNRAFHAERYDKADARYAAALKRNPQSAEAMLNQGLTALKRGDYDAATAHFDEAAKSASNKSLAASAYYNSGVARQTQAASAQDEGQKQQALHQAIEEYKKSLRLNPGDEAARYNLALCQKQLKDDQQNQNKQDKQDDQNKDQNKDQEQNQDQNKDQDQQQDQDQNQQQNQDQNQQQEQQQQPQNQQQDRQTEQLLNLSRQSEQQTKDKLNRAKPAGRPRSKNW